MRPKGLPHTLTNDTEPSGACLLWKWYADKKKLGRYGELKVQGKKVYAHRFYYELLKGEIPVGYVVHHTCYNTLCVNPEHLEAVPQTENMQDWARKYYGS